MACEIIRIDDAILYVRISGIMKLAEQQSLQTAGMELITQGGTAEAARHSLKLPGWEQGVDWGDIGFLLAYGNDIAKIACVGDERWKDLAFAFVGKGLRSTEIEFFPFSSSKEAESWMHA